MKRFFTGPLAALDQDPRFVTAPSGRRYAVNDVDDVDDVDVFVAELRRCVLNARARGHRRLAANFEADVDTLLDRRLFLMMCDDTED